jgi:hypothetical protein
MIDVTEVLDRLAPALPWEADWQDVERRARPTTRRRPRMPTARRLMIAIAVLVGVLIPIAAIASEGDWWFLGDGTPMPATAPVVVKTGEWSGHPWQLVAYRSQTDGLCLSIAPKGAATTGAGAALECAQIEGVPRTDDTKPGEDLTITFLTAGGGDALPAYIVGPVVASAAEVEIVFAGGDVMRVPTFRAPASLGDVRFYAAQRPAAFTGVEKLTGFDSAGAVVACLGRTTTGEGESELSACR